MQLPDLTARIRVDTSDLDRAVGRAVKSGSAIGSALGSAVGSLAAGGLRAASSGLLSFASNGVAAFARVEDATGAAGVVFGKAAGDVSKFAQAAATNFGLSEGAALDAALSFGTVGKSAGLSGTDLTGFSTKFAGLAGDLASFRGTSPEQAIEAIGAALRGEAEPIRAYGVLLDDATLRNEALSLGLIKNVKEALTPQQKALAAAAAITKQTKDATGDFARTSESTANTQKRLAAETENASAKLGQKLAPAITAAREGFLKALKGADGLINGFGRLFDKVAPVITQVSNGLQPALSKASEKLKDLKDAIPQRALEVLAVVAGTVAAAIVVQTAATAALSVAKGVLAAVTGVFTTTQNVETGATQRGTVARLAHNVATIAGTAATVAATVARGAWTAATLVWTGVTIAATAAANAARTAILLVNAAVLANPFVAVAVLLAALVAGLVIAYKQSETFRRIVDTAFNGVKTVVGNVMQFVLEKLSAVVGGFIGFAGGIIGAAAKAFSWVPGVGPKLEEANRAFGTYKAKATATLDGLAIAAGGLGGKAGDAHAGGVRSKVGAAGAAADTLSSRVRAGLQRAPEGAHGAGARAGQGLVNGLNSKALAVAAAAQRLAISVGRQMSSGLQERSPSKVTTKIGAFAGEGLVLGLRSQASNVRAAAGLLASAAVPDVAAPTLTAASTGGVTGPAATAVAGDSGIAGMVGALMSELAALRADVQRLPGDYMQRQRTGTVVV